MNPVLDTPNDIRLMALATQWLLALFVLMGLSAGAWWLVRHPMWQLAGITVQGEVAHQNAISLRSHLAARLQGSFLTLDLAEVRELFETAPWVREAVVQRQFPNRLRVTLTEHQPVAWWGQAGEERMLNTFGEVFAANPDAIEAEAMVELHGPDDQAPRVLAMYRDLSSVFGRIDQEVRRLELSPRGSWQVQLSNQARIELGRGDAAELMARASQFVATVGQVTSRYQRDIEAADLRYLNGYAVRMRGVTTLEAPPKATPAARPAAAASTAPRPAAAATRPATRPTTPNNR